NVDGADRDTATATRRRVDTGTSPRRQQADHPPRLHGGPNTRGAGRSVGEVRGANRTGPVAPPVSVHPPRQGGTVRVGAGDRPPVDPQRRNRRGWVTALDARPGSGRPPHLLGGTVLDAGVDLGRRRWRFRSAH